MPKNKTESNQQPELGDLVQCKITGYKGVLVAVTRWMTGCDRCLIQSQDLKDGKPIDGHNVDITMVDVLKKEVVRPENRMFRIQMEASVETGLPKGGPRPSPQQKPFIPQR